ncbi:MAG TPA: hypothetical protein HA306_01940 [Methanosarcina sp.]|nr:hypothetical protein [Methanosarcina sp.]
MFSLVPNCALADEETALTDKDDTQPLLPEEDFGTMQSRMIESVDRMIEVIGNSTENLDADTLESAEEMMTELTSIKEQISEAETESDLQTIREELGTLLEEAPEELKTIPGFGMGPGHGQSQNGSEVSPRSPGNMSEGRPEIPEGADAMSENMMNKNSSMEKQGTPGQVPASQENTENAENSDTDTSNGAGFFEKLINNLKALFS